MADFLEGYAVWCSQCSHTRPLPDDAHPFHPTGAPVADMPAASCESCGGSLVIRWRHVEIEEVEAVS